MFMFVAEYPGQPLLLAPFVALAAWWVFPKIVKEA
jgi:hypothetical protein